MKRRKHKVVVEITLDKPCTQKHATRVVDDLISSAEAGAWYEAGVTTWSCKQFSRVIQHHRKEQP